MSIYWLLNGFITFKSDESNICNLMKKWNIFPNIIEAGEKEIFSLVASSYFVAQNQSEVKVWLEHCWHTVYINDFNEYNFTVDVFDYCTCTSLIFYTFYFFLFCTLYQLRHASAYDSHKSGRHRSRTRSRSRSPGGDRRGAKYMRYKWTFNSSLRSRCIWRFLFTIDFK